MRVDVRLLVAVGIGGAVGSIARYLLNMFIQTHTSGNFPAGTMVINISGSLLLGFLMKFGLDTTAMSPEVKLLLTTGFCGGFTTFSTFSYDAVTLVENGEYGRASWYVLGSVILSFAGTLLGVGLARRVIESLRGRASS